MAWTLQVGRARMPHRRSLVASSVGEAVDLLRQPEAVGSSGRVTADTGVGVAFLFPGQGALQPGMAEGLYGREPVFTESLDRCAAILEPIIGTDLRAVMFPEPGDAEAAGEALGHAGIAQPATFALEYALARLWMSWGLRPAVMVGHSMGEFVAACLGGVFELEDALRVIAARGRLMQELDGGSMLAIMREAEAVAPLLDASTSLAAINAPTRCVASGPAASIDALERRLVADGVDVRRLPIGHAAHSAMMDPMVGPLQDLVQAMPRGSLGIPMISTATGEWVRDGQVADPEYWGRHARETVRFSDAVARLLERPGLVVIEVGPGPVARLLRPPAARRLARPRRSSPRCATRTRTSTTHVFLLRSLGQAWAAGASVDWAAVHGAARRRVGLPTYPFERERHWIERRGGTAPRPGACRRPLAAHSGPAGERPA